MDATGTERTILSLTSPGIPSITDPALAKQVARHTNDVVHQDFVQKHRDRFSMLACIPTQDPEAAAADLRRAVTDLGALGALVTGYTNAASGIYLDDPSFEPLWSELAELTVPLYLHPREPLPSQRRIYEGHDSLIGSAWAFAHETGTHALRLMLSGLFDRHPTLLVILGHLGEGLPFLLPRLEHRLHIQRDGLGLGAGRQTVSAYFNDNFYVTTTGHFHTRTLFNTISELGVDRAMRTRLPLRTHGGSRLLVRQLPPVPQRRPQDRPGERPTPLFGV
jgi:2,3-dihydroxybenzoate decarboxylase